MADVNPSDTDVNTDETPDPSASTDTGTPDLAAEVAKWKAMARKHETESKANATAAAKLAKIEEASKTELERAQSLASEAEVRVKDAEARANRALVRAAASTVASKVGAIDVDAVLALMPSDTVTVDGDEVIGVDEAIEALRTSKPHLFSKPKPSPGSADGGQQSPKSAQWTREDLKGKSPAQINEARKAGLLDAVMAGA
jgi:hypothetical protein